jgi:hypothetical protein
MRHWISPQHCSLDNDFSGSAQVLNNVFKGCRRASSNS